MHRTHFQAPGEPFTNVRLSTEFSDDDSFQFQANSDTSLDSEKSYEALCTKAEVSEFIAFLPFDIDWMLVAAFAAITLFVFYTYMIVFDETFNQSVAVILISIVCNLIVILDTISMIVHMFWKRVAARKEIPPVNKWFLLLDTLTSAFIFADLTPNIKHLKVMASIVLFFAFFRLYRVMSYFVFVTRTSGHYNISTLVKKYGMVLILLVHGFACIWQELGCYNCKDGKTRWPLTMEGHITFGTMTPYKFYIVCSYFMLGMLTSVGFGEIHGFTPIEHIFSILAMFVGLMLMSGMFLGAYTSVQVEGYRRHSQFLNRFLLIRQKVTHPKISKVLRKKILAYYYTFWFQHKAVKRSTLFESLPMSLQQQVHLDIHWDALNQSYSLKYAHDAFRCLLATKMHTEIYTQGEIIYHQDKQKDTMIYIVKGNVQLLSAQDGESAILTLGVGTCLGDSSLILTFPSPVQVIASSYCIIQCLNKRELWYSAVKCEKLNQSKRIHARMKRKLEIAKDENEVRKSETRADTLNESKCLRIVKAKLKVEHTKIDVTEIEIRRERSTHSQAVAGVTNLYVLSKHQTTLKHSDEIFLHTSWPWILQPQSVFLRIWEYIVVIAVFFVAITYPYHVSFTRYFSPHFKLAMMMIDTIYLLDIFLQIFTAIEVKGGVVSTLSDIIPSRFKQISFLIDIIAILPIYYIATGLKITKNKRVFSVLSINRLVKIHKIINFLTKFGSSFHVNIALVRCVKYILFFLFQSYFMGSLFYMMACFENCEKNSWYDKIMTEDLNTKGNRYMYDFQMSLYFAVIVISQAGFGDITPSTVAEVLVVMVFFIIGTFTYSYLVCDYSATLMLSGRAKSQYNELVLVIKKFLEANRMLPNIQYRVHEFLALQWRFNRGYYIIKGLVMLHDTPIQLFNQQLSEKFSDIIGAIPVFQLMEEDCIDKIAEQCKETFLPPNEVVVYAGEVPKDMYIIEKGFCEVISAATNNVVKIIGPSSHFGIFEMVLGRPMIHNIRTVTHVRLVQIKYGDIKKIFTLYPHHQNEIDQLVEVTNASLPVQRLYWSRCNTTFLDIKEEEEESWFIFPRRKLNFRNMDYLAVFSQMQYWKFTRYLLMRRTLMPEGQFILVWEMIRAIFAFLSCMIYPAVMVYETYWINFTNYLYILDLIGYIDIYLRFHVCYYNERGILVSHPKYTAYNYLTKAFVIDVLGIFPMAFIVYLTVGSTSTDIEENRSFYFKLQSGMRLNRLLQLYRLPDAFAMFERDIIKSKSITLNILKYFPISLVFFNVATCILLFLTTDITEKNHRRFIYIRDNSWLSHYMANTNVKFTTGFELYVVAYYWIATTSLSVGFGDIKAQTGTEMCFIIITIVAGYLLFTYILVIISSSKASINVHLTLYQEHMKHLVSFMTREKVPMKLQQMAINHFEYIWQRTHGIRPHKILQKIPFALREDAVLCLYEQTLMQVPVFIDLDKSFYRLMGMHLQERYLLRHSAIVRLNDIVNMVFIVHKGEVAVKGPDGSHFATLTRGCMFGNIDNVPSTRSMTSVIASKAVDLLCIHTQVMYYLSKEYPIVGSRLRRHVLLENLTYIGKHPSRNVATIKSDEYIIEKPIHQSLWSKLVRWFLSGGLDFLMAIMSFLSCWYVPYHLAFQRHTVTVLFSSYFLDVVHLFQLVLGFFSYYHNDMGDLVTNGYMIRRRYTRSPQLYLGGFALIPFEIFALLAPQGEVMYYLTILRLNRMLRMWHIYSLFNITFDRLNINVAVIKLGAIMSYIMLLTHIGSCLLYMFACPRGVCLPGHWMITQDGKVKCIDSYMCSIYFMATITTFTGLGDLSPRNITEMILCSLMMIASKFVLAIVIGDMSAVVQNNSYSLVNYDHGLNKMTAFMKNGAVSEPLVNRMLSYCNQLWDKDKGHQMPDFLLEAPNFLVENIKAAAYGRHLYQNSIFEACHQDFLRLLIAKLKPTTYFTGHLICKQGSINDTMYFIHKGAVEVYEVSDRNETLTHTLQQNDCFGMIQGLFINVPHSHTYKAVAATVILNLTLTEWMYLLKFYPAARFLIYDKIQHI